MSLQVGIVGLPNAGKSTLFNALVSRRLAETAPRLFTTIDPHEAVAALPDRNLEKLSKLIKPKETVPASVTFIDIAGLVKDAHKGEGLGNQFLAKIREVDVIVHVVRAFEDSNVAHQHPIHTPGSLEQIIEDIEIVNLELELGEIKKKPTIYVINIGESQIGNKETVVITKKIKDKFKSEAITLSAKLEEEFIDLSTEEREEYLKSLAVKESGLNQLINAAYKLLNLITFYTIKGGKEIHAWSIVSGSTAIEAAEEVHTDFAKNFIKAEVIEIGDLFSVGDWKQAKEKGKIRLEGKDYIVNDEDVIEFKTNA
ncbi:YchF family ATPase [Patescibacteria group bacterium]|nr:YchF family ATPase [Patescibacteria group bacterium]MBU0777152.1 YchF family ATPase [Patescibacteria group bacterium]MBU0845846.1 YchF family ATPase [Patescibacteria group bacterium]MBU0922873.1 YchF family ATPase [Patescibacteria group bacterium]MBU1066394.1 YchF family ATPase [Patescibacteria group bacterium]